MAIKTKSSRDTYRSNVKARPLRQNGLEAQYQGLDVKEVNIDHSGLPILARGGFQSSRNFTKVFKEYVVDIDADEYFPKAALVFKKRNAPTVARWKFSGNQWTGDINFTVEDINYKLVFVNNHGGISLGFGTGTDRIQSIGLQSNSTLFSSSIADIMTFVKSRLESANGLPSGWTVAKDSDSFTITHTAGTKNVTNTGLTYAGVNQTAGSIDPNVFRGNWSFDPAGSGTYVGINELDTNNVTFTLVDPAGVSKVFEYTTNSSNTNGSSITHPSSSTNIAVVVPNDSFSYLNTMQATTGSITAAFGDETFTFELHQSGTIETVDLDGKSQAGIFRVTETDPGKVAIPVSEDKIIISLKTPDKGSAALSTTFSTFLDASANTFGDQSEKHRWRLGGFKEEIVNSRIFHEDLRTDILQSFAPHERRKEGSLIKPVQRSRGALNDGSTSGDEGFHVGGIMVNADGHMNSRAGSGTSLDPVTLARSVTKLSDELLIRQTPKRQEVFGTFRDNHIWREDRHFLSMVDQRWEQMQERALLYDTDLESHISALLDTNFADEQYFDDNPLSGRVDIFGRLSRVFDTHNEIIYERHRGSVFDQFLDPADDFKILQETRYPKADETSSYSQVIYNHATLTDEKINHTNDPAFEDIQGTRRALQSDPAAPASITLIIGNGSNATPPSNGDKLVIEVGNGWESDVGIEIKFNTGGNNDSSFQALGSLGVVDLEIDVSNNLNNTPTEIATKIETALNSLSTTPVNSVDISGYVVTKDVSSANACKVILTSLKPGVGWNLNVTNDISSMATLSSSSVSGIDSLWARENSVMFVDYFDQLPMEKHDYSETERFTRIDSEMLAILTFDDNRTTHIDRREWQESDYLYTSTGFVSSQVTPQDGIIYREMKR